MDSAPHTDIMDVHSSTSHGSMDWKPRTLGASERTATPVPPNQQLIRVALGGKLQGADIRATDCIGETERVLMNDNVDVDRPTDEPNPMDCDGMSITSSQIQEIEGETFSHRKKLRTDIMDVQSPTTHDRNERTPTAMGANEGTAAPPHRVGEVLDEDNLDNTKVRVNDVLSGREGEQIIIRGTDSIQNSLQTTRSNTK